MDFEKFTPISLTVYAQSLDKVFHCFTKAIETHSSCVVVKHAMATVCINNLL
jgi:transcription elongation factor Elf1